MRERLLFAIVLALASFFFSTPVFADEWIYSDDVQPGWQLSGSYDVDTLTQAAFPSPHTGQYSFQAIYTDQWGAVRFENTSGGFTGPSDGSVTIWFYLYDTNDSTLSSDVEIALFDTSGNMIGTADFRTYASSLASMQWNEVTVPLSDLGAEGRAIGSIELQSEHLITIYYDDLHFSEGDGGTSPPPAGSAETVHDDVFGSGWEGWMWSGVEGTDYDFTSTGISPESGTSEIRVSYIAGDSLEFHNTSGFDTTNYNTLSFAINGGSTGGEDVHVFLLDQFENQIGSGVAVADSLGGSVPVSEWTEVHIPLSDLGIQEGDTVWYVDFYSASNGTTFYDDIRFSSQEDSGGCSDPQVLGYSESAPPMATLSTSGSCLAPTGPSLFYFDEEKIPGTDRWSWNVSEDTEVSSPVFDGTKAIKVGFSYPNPDGGNSGVQFHSDKSFNPNSSQYIAFAIRGVYPSSMNVALIDGSEPSGQSIEGAWVSLTNYLHGCMPDQQWCQIVIPMTDLVTFSPVNGISGFTVESFASGTVYLDEVQVVGVETWLNHFKLPLPAEKHWQLTVEAGGEAYDGIDDAFHYPENAYYSLDFNDVSQESGQETDVPILASAGGVVEVVGLNHEFNGNYVVIDHDGDGNISTGIVTYYLHMKDSSIVVHTGQTVVQGQKLGILGGSGQHNTGTHLHFQFKYNGQRDINTDLLKFVRIEGRKIEEYHVGTLQNPTYFPSTNVQ